MDEQTAEIVRNKEIRVKYEHTFTVLLSELSFVRSTNRFVRIMNNFLRKELTISLRRDHTCVPGQFDLQLLQQLLSKVLSVHFRRDHTRGPNY